jgi:molecular chaperone HscB
MPTCDDCGVPLETPVGCAACGAVHSLSETAAPFEILGLAPSFAIDERDLRRRLTRFSRLVHPDFFAAAAPDVRERAERNSAQLNAAYDVLADPVQRADWLLENLGGPAKDVERSMAQAFLAEVLDWNEVLEEARASNAADPRIERLESELVARRAAGLEAIARLFDPLPERGSPALTAVRREWNALRYLDRALRSIEALRLARAALR